MTRKTDILDELPGVAYRAAPEPSRPLLYASAGAMDLLGRPPAELLKDPPASLEALVHPEDRARLAHQVERTLEGGGLLEIRYRILTPEGEERWVWDRGRLVRDAEGRSSLAGVLVDASGLRLLENRAVSGARRQALGELTGAFAHRFNNLLSAILGPIELALDATSPKEDLHRDLVIAQRAAEQAANLTNHLRAFSQRQIGRPDVVSVNEVVRGLEDMVRELLRPRIRVMVNLSPEAPSVRVDRQQLEQVIVNLVLNARDAMPDGGRLVISTGTRHLVETDLRRDDDLEPGTYTALKVVDTGEGIPEELRGRVFEPFFSTRSGRAGLGLSTVYGIVRQVGGVVRVGTGARGGAMVNVLLPVAGAGAMSRPEPEGDASTGRRVLVVDDEEAVLEVSVRALRRWGYVARGVPDQASALAALEEWGGRVDLVVLDMMLGATTGPRLAAALVRRAGPLRVMFMSAFVDDDGLADLGMPEGTVFLAKPFTLQKLGEAVERALERAPWEAPDGSGTGRGLEAEVG